MSFVINKRISMMFFFFLRGVRGGGRKRLFQGLGKAESEIIFNIINYVVTANCHRGGGGGRRRFSPTSLLNRRRWTANLTPETLAKSTGLTAAD